MMQETTEREQATELVLAGACMVCNGDLTVKITPAGAASVSPHCRWIARPELSMEKSGLEMRYHPAGLA